MKRTLGLALSVIMLLSTVPIGPIAAADEDGEGRPSRVPVEADRLSADGQDGGVLVPVLIRFIERPGPAQEALVRARGGVVSDVLQSLPVVAARVPRAAVPALRANPNVVYVEEDVRIQIVQDDLSWGVDRIDAEVVWGGAEDARDAAPGANVGAGVKVAIVDTGIDLDHPDLAANIAGNVTFVFGTMSGDDDNGHGTHVAGTVAAADNGVGVLGVAPGASLYAVKVMDRNGSGYISRVIAGIEWAMGLRGGVKAHVINMSLSTNTHVQTFQDAVAAASAAGIVLVAAAGNDGTCSGAGDTVDYPARYPQVIAVAATTSADGVPCFSSTGPAVELAAPGVSISSTYLNGSYRTLSGTSMAAPHVAGVAALVLASGALTDQDGDGDLDNMDVRLRLQRTAEPLGLSSAWIGYGLVDALAAAGQTLPPANQAPVADPGGPYGGDEGVSIQFDGSGSHDPDGDSLTYSWDFGDGTVGTGVSPAHAYASAGTFTVTLVVNDGVVDSAPASTTATVAGPNEAPTADPGGPYSGRTGAAIAFDGSGSSDPNGDPLTYAWDFGDGATGSGVRPSHVYAAAGDYTVTLVVNDGTEDSAPVTTTATVTASSAVDVTITDFSAADISWIGFYRFNAQVRNESSTGSVTVAASLEVLDASGALVAALEDRTVTIGAGATAQVSWWGRISLPRGTYTARLTIPSETPPEVATDTFQVA